LREFERRAPVYLKISQVLPRVDGRIPEDAAFHRARLDELCGVFGEDRVLYASDSSNSDQEPRRYNLVICIGARSGSSIRHGTHPFLV
jgi:hypothetical protein